MTPLPQSITSPVSLTTVFTKSSATLIDQMEQVSHRMRAIASKFSEVRRRLDTMAVVQTNRGHELRILFDDGGDIKDALLSFDREGEGNNDKQIRCDRDTSLSYTKYHEKEPIKLDHNSPVPLRLMEKAEEIIAKNFFKQYKFLNIRIDDDFAQRAPSLFVRSQQLIFMGCENTLSTEGVQKFFNWIISKPLIFFLRSDFEGCGFIDESVIRAAVANLAYSIRRLSFEKTPDEMVKKATFTATRDMISSLSRFNRFSLMSMIIDIDFLIDALMKALRLGVQPEHWVVRVTALMRDGHFANRQHIKMYSLTRNGREADFMVGSSIIHIYIEGWESFYKCEIRTYS